MNESFIMNMAKIPSGVVITDTYKRSFGQTVREMVGRVLTQTADIVSGKNTYDIYNYRPTYDYEQSNYTLTRAVFLASEIRDPVSKKSYGKEYILGATLAKPIVNSAAAFAVGKLPEVISEDNSADDQVKNTNAFIERNKDRVFKVVRNCFRDGDHYTYLNPTTMEVRLISPSRVTKVFDPITGELQGYDIESFIKDQTKNTTDRYVEELRIKGPHRVLKVYKNNARTATELETTGEDPEDIAPLRLTGWHNEREDDQLFGVSEYQNLYALFANYHAVLENGIKNNIYNSNALPVFEGIKNMKEFMEKNGERQDDGTYKLKWDPDKLIIGGEGMSAKILSGVTNASEVQLILNIIFWLVCQASETPEFVFGTAVQSSKASVSEQMPIAVMKAQRKQSELHSCFVEFITSFTFYAKDSKQYGNAEWDPELEFEIKFPPILDDDLKLNIEIVTTLSEQGCITDNTKLLLLGMGKYIGDFDKEIKEARKEMKKKEEAATAFADPIAGQNAEIAAVDDPTADPLTPEEAAIANAPAQ